MNDSRNKYYYDTIKNAMASLKLKDARLNILDAYDENKLPCLFVDIDTETKEYSDSESREYLQAANIIFHIYYYYKIADKQNIAAEIRAQNYYWIDLIESKLEGLTWEPYNDTINSKFVQIIDIKLPVNEKLFPDNERITGIRLTGEITVAIIHNT